MMSGKDVYYFSHDANARNDEKILMLRAEHGWEGYGIFWALIEMMFESSDTALYHDKIKGIAVGLSVSFEKLNDIINFCIEEELFKSDGQIYWSDSLRRRKDRFKEISALRAEAGRKGGKIRADRLKKAQEKGTHTKEEWEEMVEFFNYRCVACGCEIQESTPVKGQIKPIHEGGSDDITNIQPLCKSCNSSKSQDKTDYRLSYCQANAKQMPSKFQASSSIKGKESKVNKSKDKDKHSCPELKIPDGGSDDSDAVTDNKTVKDKGYADNKTFNADDKPFKAAVYLRQWIKNNNPRARVPPTDVDNKNMQDWALEMDRLNRIGPVGGDKNGYGWDEIRDLIDFCQQDSFWRGQILSAGNFREKIIQLENRMREKCGQNNQQANYNDPSRYKKGGKYADLYMS